MVQLPVKTSLKVIAFLYAMGCLPVPLLVALLLGPFGCYAEAFGSSPYHVHHSHPRHPDKRLLLNSLTPLDVSGEHAWQPPREGDQRGPCPGLNALANHGFIPRDGVVGMLEVIPVINEVYGMSIEFATLLAVLGTVWTGNPISLDPSFSIGGNDTEVQNLLGNVLGLLGTPQGLDHSHNIIEADSSPTRDDLYATGDPVTMNLTTFETLYDMLPEQWNTSINAMEVLADFASVRFDHSIATNPYFYYGPVVGLVSRNTGYCIVGNLFANYSTEYPEGIITRENMKSFYGVTGDRSNFTYSKGHERIPENWYKTTVEYTMVQLNLDIVYMLSKYPKFGSVGGNMGEVNSFTGVDLADPAGGLLNIGNLLEGNHLLCFALEIVNMAAPNYLNNLVSTLVQPLELLLKTVALPLLNLSCPQLGEITRNGVPLWESLGAEFPGANMSGSAL